MPTLRSTNGFSLLEVLVALAIVSLLAALAVPTWSMEVARSRQVEAKTDLSNIYALEMGFHQEKATYGNIAEIGFVPTGTHYTYCVGTASCVAASSPLDYGGSNPSSSGGGTITNNGDMGGAAGNGTGTGGGGPPAEGAYVRHPGPGQNGASDSATDPIVPVPGGNPGGGMNPAPQPIVAIPSVAANGHYGADSFEADAFGRISASPAPHDIDAWLIDESRDLVNVSVGY
ncbi:MAG TPA: type II secretion system protein [bacterium]|nr:type II secretion system protein [bacterium]